MSGGLLVAPLSDPALRGDRGLRSGGAGRASQKAIGVAGAAALLVAAAFFLHVSRRRGVLAVQVGSWPAPFGITLVADLLSAIMVLVTAVVGLAVATYALGESDDRSLAAGFFPSFTSLLVGVCGAFLTGDLFNLYVWFEVMLIASFVLLSSAGGRRALTVGSPTSRSTCWRRPSFSWPSVSSTERSVR